MAGDPTGAHGFQTTTDCIITFQVEDGGPMRFSVPNSEYRMLAEGDRGRLTFQGTRYLDFDRRC